jgi:Fur family iron response transcriptional regulator
MTMTQARSLAQQTIPVSLAEHSPPAAHHADRTGCPWHDVKAMLRGVGLRPTRQRMALGWILFAKGDRHVTAEMLYEEATESELLDIPDADMLVGKLPAAPDGYEISRIDVVVRLRRKQA